MKPKELEFSPCELKEIRKFVEENHYSHSVNGVKISYCFKATYQGELVGGALFGQMSTTAWKKFGDCEIDVIELRRLVLLDCAERNSESHMVGWMLRWLKKEAPFIKIVVSYADPIHSHVGTIYKASNFTFVGMSGADKGFQDIETGKIYHSRALRTKYNGEYKPFVKRLREKLKSGLLLPIDLPGKYCYTYSLQS